MQSAKSIMWKILQGNCPGFLNEYMAMKKKKGSGGGGRRGDGCYR